MYRNMVIISTDIIHKKKKTGMMKAKQNSSYVFEIELILSWITACVSVRMRTGTSCYLIQLLLSTVFIIIFQLNE